MLAGLEGFANLLAPDLYSHELTGYHLSKYMNKFMAEGKRIYFIHYRKI
jgi:tRNA (guanine-N7-)-methyltransferase